MVKIISRAERICRKEFTDVGYCVSCLDFTSNMVVRSLLSKIERRNFSARGVAGLPSIWPIGAGSTYLNRHFCQQLQFGGLSLSHTRLIQLEKAMTRTKGDTTSGLRGSVTLEMIQ